MRHQPEALPSANQKTKKEYFNVNPQIGKQIKHRGSIVASIRSKASTISRRSKVSSKLSTKFSLFSINSEDQPSKITQKLNKRKHKVQQKHKEKQVTDKYTLYYDDRHDDITSLDEEQSHASSIFKKINKDSHNNSCCN